MQLRISSAALLVLLTSGSAYAALDPQKSFSQYTQQVWRADTGLPNNSVTAIAQTSDGYLWLGTEEGLARFDGVHFAVFDQSNTEALKSNRISALLVDSQQQLWIGTTGGGVTRLAKGKFVTFTTKNGLASDAVLSLFEDSSKTIWIGTDGGGLNSFRHGRFQLYNSRNGLPNDAIFSIAGTPDGRIWIGTHEGLAVYDHGSFKTYRKENGLTDNYIRSVLVDRKSTVWVGTDGHGIAELIGSHFVPYRDSQGATNQSVWSLYEDSLGEIWASTLRAGLQRFDAGHFVSFRQSDGLPLDRILCSFEDKEGNFWIGTGGAGLLKLSNGLFNVVTSREGLSGDVVLPVLEDHTGAVWAGTNGSGVNRIEHGRVTQFTSHNGLTDDVVLSLAETKDSSVWIATRKGVNRYRNGKFEAFSTRDGLPSNLVLAFYVDRTGVLWAGTHEGLSYLEENHFKTFTTKDGLSNNYVTSLYADAENNLWIGTGGGGLDRLKHGHFSVFNTKNGLSSNAIWSLNGDKDGTLWIGTSGGGLNRFRNGRFTTLTSHQGLLDDEIYEALSDDLGYLWMTSNKGIWRIPKWQIDAVAKGEASTVHSVTYGEADGLKNQECNGGFQPSGWRTTAGRLLFPTMRGLAVVDPAKVVKQMTPLRVIIERVAVNGKSFESDMPGKFAPGAGQLQFEFTAPTFTSSDKIDFRYKLEGFDRDWIEAKSRRAAYYTNIPPGEYKFLVSASRDGEKWATEPASVSFVLLPHFYQTSLFIASCVFFVIGISVIAYRVRVEQLRQTEKRLRVLVDERTHALQEEVFAKERAHTELAAAQRELIELSRRSGMAEVASSVLHNVGNVLNSVNVSSNILSAKVEELRLDKLAGAIDLLQQNSTDLSAFVAHNPKGQRILPYLSKLSTHLQDERKEILSELQEMVSHVDHIKQIVAIQQDHAKVSALMEPLNVEDLVKESIELAEASGQDQEVQILRDFQVAAEVLATRHKVVEILVNLIKNAKQAVAAKGGPDWQVVVRILLVKEGKVAIQVQDCGVGIPEENLTKIFGHGFTTKDKGHGFGLHSSALAARQMNGSLSAESAGKGLGATFTLELPCHSTKNNRDSIAA